MINDMNDMNKKSDLINIKYADANFSCNKNIIWYTINSGLVENDFISHFISLI